MEVHVSDIDGQTERLNGADGISDIEHVAIGNGAFGESDIEGKAAMGSGECGGKRASFNRAGRRQRS